MNAPIGTRCTGTCRRPAQTQAHCSVCHRTFGGLSGFDAHRRNGLCLDPESKRMREVDGVWRWPAPAEGAARPWGAGTERRTGRVASSVTTKEIDHA